jgi:ElaB/YqjD/DUF883 family membrane-anchored ribosome-binding protein
MSTNLTVIADLKAGLDALTAEVGKLKATQPNLDHFANQLGGHLVKFEANVTSSFTDKFAGNLFRATDAWNTRVADIEDTLIRLEQMLADNATKSGEMLDAHRKKVAKMLEAHQKSISDLLAGNDQKIAEQKVIVSRMHEYLSGYDKHFVELHNNAVALVDSTELTVEKVDAAVEKFDAISTGPLEEVAKKAEETITLASTTARQEMEKVRDETRMQIEGTRKHYRKVLAGFDNRFAEHPLLVMSCFILIIGIAFGFIGVWAGRIGEARHTQQLIDNSVEVITQNVEERMTRIDEQTKSLNDTFQEARYWEELTNNMSFDQKMAYIKLAQEQAQRQGHRLELPRAMREEKAKK